MSALQDLASCQLMPHPGFAVKNPKRRKITPLRQRAEQEAGTTQPSEDPELIEQAVAGDSAAQSRLFATHTPRLYRVAFNVLRNKEDAEDAVQDGWCRAYSKLHTFEGRSSFSTWLTRIVINSALMIRRRNKHQFLTLLDEVFDDARGLQHCLVDGRRTPEEACGDGEMNELLVRHIQQLPPPTRTAFLLRYMDELGTSESMERLGVNKSALKSRVLRARRRIAQNMRQSLHADRQRNRSFMTEDCAVANRSSTATSSTGEASNDWV
jgi:RNA polymerase sigma-70 factor, ECF subfamily